MKFKIGWNKKHIAELSEKPKKSWIQWQDLNDMENNAVGMIRCRYLQIRKTESHIEKLEMLAELNQLREKLEASKQVRAIVLDTACVQFI